MLLYSILFTFATLLCFFQFFSVLGCAEAKFFLSTLHPAEALETSEVWKDVLKNVLIIHF